MSTLALLARPAARLMPPCLCRCVQPAVVAAVTHRAEDESIIVRLTMPPGVSSTFHDNDMLMLSRDNPEVRRARH